MTVGENFEIKSTLLVTRPLALALAVVCSTATFAESTTEATSHRYVTVKEGDTLTKILLRTLGTYTPWREVALHNKLVPPYLMKPGDVLVLPGSVLKRFSKPAHSPIREVTTHEQRYEQQSVELVGNSDSRTDTTLNKEGTRKSVSAGDLVVIVKKGDSISKILRRNFGSLRALNEVIEYNKLNTPDALEPGDIIRIPSWLLTNKTAKQAEQTVQSSSIESEITQKATVQPEVQLPIPPPRLEKITLQKISVEGNTAISDTELASISEPYLNRPLRFSDLEQLRIDITRAYTDQGFISSGAILPNQKITNGELTYRVVEGRLDEIEVSGTGRLKPAYVANRVRAAAGEPFNSKKLQESFQLLLDDPLIDRMDGQLLPQPETGLTKLKLAVTPSAPWLLNLTADNHGSPSVGAEQLALAGTYLNPTGLGDRTDFSLNVSPGRYNLSAAYSLPVSARDTRLTLDFGASNSTVIEEPLDNIDIESDSANFGLSISHPLRRSTTGSFTVGADVTVRDNSNTLLGAPFSFSVGEQNGESRVTALRLWQDVTRKRSDQVFALRSSFNFGLDSFGSTVNDDDLPDSEFVSWLGQMRLVQNVQDGAGQVLLKANTQYTNDTLLPLERFSLGGADSVRGFRKNQLVRDNALLLTAEYQYSFHQSASAGKWTVAPFVDYGYGRNEGTETNSETLTSTGIGLLWSKGKFNADLYFGHTLENASDSTEDDFLENGIHFRFSTRFY